MGEAVGDGHNAAGDRWRRGVVGWVDGHDDAGRK
jgi:hypothetical protein